MMHDIVKSKAKWSPHSSYWLDLLIQIQFKSSAAIASNS